MKLFEVYPQQDVVIDKARGVFVWDDKGNRYLDMYGGHAVVSIGHTHPHYVSRLTEQLQQIGFYSNAIRMPLQEALAEKLGQLSGRPDYRLFLCNSGAEANENALKLASFHNGRDKVLAFDKAFHGRTSLAVAATDNPSLVAPVNVTDKIHFLPFNDEEALQSYFKEKGDTLSSVIIEGIQGVGGIRVAQPSFLQLLRRLCDAHGALLIADSVQCGYGRSGRFFSHDHSGIDADIYTMAKGMGNGFPVGGILIAPHIKAKMGMLGTTFGGNHLACVAALAVLEVMEKENLMQRATDTGTYLMQELAALPGIEAVRGAGLMIGFDVPGKQAKLRHDLLYRQRVFTGEAKPDAVRLLPPLCLNQEEAGLFLTALREALPET
ncbi:aspartate aminotransferase family protein [Taibaiella koreensis]|uniref:aspartate aminotransferase family protein n=1 Tax=Taibaiella koreensis TaxID=1268548 RepID=UPI000E5A0BB0|nr:aminotransferase class III-fold pyridoxal phosphate-dependent enzyme [Taibaiella koreensis]